MNVKGALLWHASMTSLCSFHRGKGEFSWWDFLSLGTSWLTGDGGVIGKPEAAPLARDHLPMAAKQHPNLCVVNPPSNAADSEDSSSPGPRCPFQPPATARSDVAAEGSSARAKLKHKETVTARRRTVTINVVLESFANDLPAKSVGETRRAKIRRRSRTATLI